jgi:hypothetical protein
MNGSRIPSTGPIRLAISTVVLAMLGEVAQAQQTPGACGYYTNSSGHQVPRPCGNWHMNSGGAANGASALCGDGTYSYSEHPYAPGTCSHHGWVVKLLR